MNCRGYFGIGIERSKIEYNIGTLWRTAHLFGASFIFTIGRRYRPQCSDTTKAWKHIPLHHFITFNEFYKAIPHDCLLVGIELDNTAIPIYNFSHPERCIYLLGAEDHGLTIIAKSKCRGGLVTIPSKYSLNVAVAGSIVVYDRYIKRHI